MTLRLKLLSSIEKAVKRSQVFGDLLLVIKRVIKVFAVTKLIVIGLFRNMHTIKFLNINTIPLSKWLIEYTV